MTATVESMDPLFWQIDADLEVTSLSPALSELTGITKTYHRIHLADLWDAEGPYGLTVRSHRWALRGMPISVMARKDGMRFRLELEPLVGPDGRVTGVIGLATELEA